MIYKQQPALKPTDLLPPQGWILGFQHLCSTSQVKFESPLQVSVSPGAALLMDFHAHLSENEVVGLLGGTWNHQERLLR